MHAPDPAERPEPAELEGGTAPESATGADDPERDTWLVAVWPGMGSVALAAGSWLASELGAVHELDLPSEEFFDVEKVEVHHGVARVGWRPSCAFHLWRNPGDGPDLLVFIGEAQPSSRGLEFCHRILEVARRHGVTRIFTFAAMATPMHPQATPRVFSVANDERLLGWLRTHPVEFLEEGQINGLNGVLLAAAAEIGIDGVCLLGEMPYFAVNVPNPGASVAVLNLFARLAGLVFDLTELEKQAETVERKLTQILSQMPQIEDADETDEAPSFLALEPDAVPPADEDTPRLTPSQSARIERLFGEAERDRGRALELKAELDRLGVFDEYEDRFLDLFREGS